jgi:fructokinase
MKAATAELASRAAVVKGSEKDLGALAGKRGMTWLEDHAKGATWVLTRGENGAACVGPHGQVTFPTKRVRCIDATGAGDAFMAGLVAVLVRSGAKPGSADWKDPKLWSRAMEVGHQLGAKAISAVGAVAAMGQLDDLRARMDAPKK